MLIATSGCLMSQNVIVCNGLNSYTIPHHIIHIITLYKIILRDTKRNVLFKNIMFYPVAFGLVKSYCLSSKSVLSYLLLSYLVLACHVVSCFLSYWYDLSLNKLLLKNKIERNGHCPTVFENLNISYPRDQQNIPLSSVFTILR